MVSYTLFITSSNDSISVQEASTTITVPASIFTPTVDLATGIYTWTVRAHDAAGNVSGPAAPESFTIQQSGEADVNVCYLPIILKN